MYGLHFYYLYPSSCCPRAFKRGTKGTFDTLQRVIVAGWSPTSDPAKLLDRSWNNGGLFIFSEKESKQIRSSMGKGMTDMQKNHMFADYQFEMGYDLAISPGCNVSESPDLNPCWESMVESRKVRLVLFVGNNIIGSTSNSPDTKQYLFHLIVKSRPGSA
jgi:hypothetical protein